MPSVSLVVNVPSSIEEGFYQGKLTVMLKDAVFQPSSAVHHAAELVKILKAGRVNTILKPILLLCSDGGPDHRVTYVSVQVAFICIFRYLQLDFLVAARTAPMQSYRNPIERCMSLLNIGLQSVGLMRSSMTADLEKLLSSNNNMSDIGETARRTLALKEGLLQSLEEPIGLLQDVLSRLSLHDEPIGLSTPASDDEVNELWECMSSVDASLGCDDTTQEKIKDKKAFKQFLKHCCVRRHYFFSIKKCGTHDCELCGKPTIPAEDFKDIHHFPDPMKTSGQDHYKPFAEVWGTETSEKDRPSLLQQQISAMYNC